MGTLKQTHTTAFLVALQKALTNALARFKTDKCVNKSLRLHITYSQYNKWVQVYK